MADSRKFKGKRGTIAGCLMIALGLVTAVFGYFRDRHSMDFTSMTNAGDFAVLHAALWGIAGVVVILWANSSPGESSGE